MRIREVAESRRADSGIWTVLRRLLLRLMRKRMMMSRGMVEVKCVILDDSEMGKLGALLGLAREF